MSTPAQFLTKLRMEDIDGTEAVLLISLRFFSARYGCVLSAPAGFRTDFASIPCGLWNLIPKRGLHDKAAVIHDAAYRGQLRNAAGYDCLVDKRLADDLFDEALQACNVVWWRRTLMVWAVRLFGRPSAAAPSARGYGK